MMTNAPNAETCFANEIHAVIDRYCNESDITVVRMLGVLTLAKLSLANQLFGFIECEDEEDGS